MFCTGPDCRQNRQLIFSPKIQYKLPAERATLCVRTDALGSEAVASGLSFSLVWSTLEIARTFAAAPTGGEKPREKFGAAKPHR